MAATYRAVMVMKKGGPEALQIVQLPVESPGPGQLRVRVRAAGVGSTDLLVVAGDYRYAPKVPVVPAYEAAGVVDAIGAGVRKFEVGDGVAALTDGVSDRDAAAVIGYSMQWEARTLVVEKKIDPLVNYTFPILEARKALELLTGGSVEGKIVLTVLEE